eukprot:SAG31_NODE_1937_length_6866_cov_3.173932_4_plen_77_part_00
MQAMAAEATKLADLSLKAASNNRTQDSSNKRTGTDVSNHSVTNIINDDEPETSTSVAAQIEAACHRMIDRASIKSV